MFVQNIFTLIFLQKQHSQWFYASVLLWENICTTMEIKVCRLDLLSIAAR